MVSVLFYLCIITANAPAAGGGGAQVVYYNVFAFLYGMAGRCANVVMVNSKWTKVPRAHGGWLGGIGAHVRSVCVGGWVVSHRFPMGRKRPRHCCLPTVQHGVSAGTRAPCCARHSPYRAVSILCARALAAAPIAADGAPEDHSVNSTGACSRVCVCFRVRIDVCRAQFRPEKDHPRQLHAFAALRSRGRLS